MLPSANSRLYKCINWCFECLEEIIEWSGIRNIDESTLQPRMYNSNVLW